MNTVTPTATHHERPPMKIEALLHDIRSGIKDDELLQKHYAILLQLEKLESMAEQRDAVASVGSSESTIDRGGACDLTIQPESEAEESCFICPSCLEPQPHMFDICPKCSISVQDAMAFQNPSTGNLGDGTDQALLEESSATLHRAILSPETPPIPTNKSPEKPLEGMTLESPKPTSEANMVNRIPVMRDKPTSQHRRSHRKTLTNSQMPVQTVVDEPKLASSAPGVRCDSCKGRMAPALRDIYDRSRSLQSFVATSICLVLGFAGSVLLSFMDGPSLARLTVFFITAIVFLGGAVFWSVGAFMYLAREKVYFCPRCKRTYPRADISYLAAAMTWTSRGTLGGFD